MRDVDSSIIWAWLEITVVLLLFCIVLMERWILLHSYSYSVGLHFAIDVLS